MSPMWLTSNTPTPPRTARCSHINPPLHGYSTGMSQPPKLPILAPRRLCSAFSGVLRRLELAGEFPESIPFAQAKIDVSTHPTRGQNTAVLGRAPASGYGVCGELGKLPRDARLSCFKSLLIGSTLRWTFHI